MRERPLFITGIGTGIGKTVVSAILAESLLLDYWKPVQAGIDNGTDSGWVGSVVSDQVKIFPETYKLKEAVSPHIAARNENKVIDIKRITDFLETIYDQRTENENSKYKTNYQLVIEGAGGLLVPLNEKEFVLDMIMKLNALVILVSRNYLGSINHSLLTAAECKRHNLKVLGWIFNDQYLNYEDEIVKWSGYPKIASIPKSDLIDRNFIAQQAKSIYPLLRKIL